MASPSLELLSAESSQSDDAFQDMAVNNTNSKKFATGRADQPKFPGAENRSKGIQNKKNSTPHKGGGSAVDDGTEGGGQQQAGSRKKRSRVTPSATDDSELSNGRKSVTDGMRDSLWPGGEGDGPVQGSLLEEVLAEKRMALLRSPEVMQFLQQRQASVHAAQQQALLEGQKQELCVGEVEEDAVS